MPLFRLIPVAALTDPLNPQRTETLLERIDELRDSIRTNGLQHPIGVRDIGDGTYRIIYGHRRSIAVTQLGWEQVPAMAYALDEGDEETLMGAENYHRTQTSLREEALFYKRIFPKYPEGTIGMSRELNVPQSRIENLLYLAQGDEQVFEYLSTGEIGISQAVEINKFHSPGYRLQALERVKKDGCSAQTLKLWRRDLQRNQLDRPVDDPNVTWAQPVQTDLVVPMGLCQIGNHSVELQHRKIYEICNEHYNIFLAGLEALGRERTLQENGLWREFQRLVAVAEGRTADGSARVQS